MPMPSVATTASGRSNRSGVRRLRVGMLNSSPRGPAVQSTPDRMAAVGDGRELAVAARSRPSTKPSEHPFKAVLPTFVRDDSADVYDRFMNSHGLRDHRKFGPERRAARQVALPRLKLHERILRRSERCHHRSRTRYPGSKPRVARPGRRSGPPPLAAWQDGRAECHRGCS